MPKNKTNELWGLFKEATRSFNTAKNDFFKEAKKAQSEALIQKQALIKEALEWKDSEDFENATENFKRIQATWKKIGFVPRKQADALWTEFKSICDAYFEKLNIVKKEGTPQEQENYEKKVAFLETLSTTEITQESYLSIEHRLKYEKFLESLHKFSSALSQYYQTNYVLAEYADKSNIIISTYVREHTKQGSMSTRKGSCDPDYYDPIFVNFVYNPQFQKLFK